MGGKKRATKGRLTLLVWRFADRLRVLFLSIPEKRSVSTERFH